MESRLSELLAYARGCRDKPGKADTFVPLTSNAYRYRSLDETELRAFEVDLSGVKLPPKEARAIANRKYYQKRLTAALAIKTSRLPS